VFVGCHDGKLYELSPEGKLLWSFATQGAISSSPAIGPQGQLVIGSRDGGVYCFQ
jgi:outer membrane protein assembly factor BamB